MPSTLISSLPSDHMAGSFSFLDSKGPSSIIPTLTGMKVLSSSPMIDLVLLLAVCVVVIAGYSFIFPVISGPLASTGRTASVPTPPAPPKPFQANSPALCTTSDLLQELSVLFASKEIGQNTLVLESIGTATKVPTGKQVGYRAHHSSVGTRQGKAGGGIGRDAVSVGVIRVVRSRTTSATVDADGTTSTKETEELRLTIGLPMVVEVVEWSGEHEKVVDEVCGGEFECNEDDHGDWERELFAEFPYPS
ncbi:hypothetical protein HDU93_008270 [Gonapodya sp. JEL0774]|nr:hypothetical protein HDU93_008270 [Gonapodya sp. JEL0774]